MRHQADTFFVLTFLLLMIIVAANDTCQLETLESFIILHSANQHSKCNLMLSNNCCEQVDYTAVVSLSECEIGKRLVEFASEQNIKVFLVPTSDKFGSGNYNTTFHALSEQTLVEQYRFKFSQSDRQSRVMAIARCFVPLAPNIYIYEEKSRSTGYRVYSGWELLIDGKAKHDELMRKYKDIMGE
jgi:hypothetical protein